MADLSSSIAKWTRARQHLKDAEEAIEAYGRTKPCTSVPHIDPNTGEKFWRAEGQPQAPPVLLDPLIGDALHNWRSALDHLAWQLVLQSNNVPTEQTAFLICDDPAKFKSGAGRRLKGMRDEMRTAIEDLQPCTGKYPHLAHLFWGLETLENIDKHRHFNLTLSACDGGFWLPGLPIRASDTAFIYSGPIEDGTILARVGREYVDVDFAPIPGVTFDGSGPNARDILFGISEVVAGTIEDFGRRFFGTSISLQRWV